MKAKRFMWIGVGAAGAVAFVGLVTSVAVWQGYLFIGVKGRTEYVAVSRDVCSSMIDKYNAALRQSDAKAMDVSLGEVSKSIDKLSDSDSDPNCVFMQLTYAMRADKTEDVKRHTATLKALADENKYISGKLYNAAGIDSVLGVAEQKAIDTSNTAVGQGNG